MAKKPSTLQKIPLKNLAKNSPLRNLGGQYIIIMSTVMIYAGGTLINMYTIVRKMLANLQICSHDQLK